MEGHQNYVILLTNPSDSIYNPGIFTAQMSKDEDNFTSPEKFVEVSWDSEAFITCPDCFRNFVTKISYNNHIENCEARLEDDNNKITRAVLGTSDVNNFSKIRVRGSRSSGNVIIKKEEEEEPEEIEIKVEPVLSSRGRVVKRSNNSSSKALKSNESFECKVCKKVYYTKYGFKLHLRTHTGNKGYTCEVCGKSFSQSGHLKDHRRIHTGEKPFVCPICDKRFAQNQNLKHHLRMHSGVKPFECKDCGKSFFTKCELNAHERTHSGVRPYPCNMCDKSFAQLHGLKGHLKTHGGAQSLDCPVCKVAFPTLTALMLHLPNHDDREKELAKELAATAANNEQQQKGPQVMATTT